MNMFDYMKQVNLKQESPLAVRMRPETLDDIVGQDHILAKDKLLYRLIKADKLASIILYGPPGTGKTTIAKVISNYTKAEFVTINATTSGKKDMEEVVKTANDNLGMYNKRTILFVDEIHRFNKSQQDYLLPFVEDGTIILIGATTENPYFEVNKALLSRSQIFRLNELTPSDVRKIVIRTLNDSDNGLGIYNPILEEGALDFLSDIVGGDARQALNAIELAVLTTTPNSEGNIVITSEIIEDCIQRKNLSYDKDGDSHYDTISAFIKSMRGSDADASVFYLAKMLEAGEDIKFIARRMMICASEDVGNADPMALVVATNAALAVERVGMPEAAIILSHAASYIALAPKSNACVVAIESALNVARTTKTTVPVHLQDSHYHGHEELGKGLGYKYPHDYENHYVKQQYLPDEIKDYKFYNDN